MILCNKNDQSCWSNCTNCVACYVAEDERPLFKVIAVYNMKMYSIPVYHIIYTILYTSRIYTIDFLHSPYEIDILYVDHVVEVNYYCNIFTLTENMSSIIILYYHLWKLRFLYNQM